MSYNINYSNQEIQLIYAFDIKIINTNNEIIKKKIITSDKIGEILECKNNIKKIKIICCLINNNINTITFKKTFNEEIDNTIVLFKKNVIIYFSKYIDNLIINFQII